MGTLIILEEKITANLPFFGGSIGGTKKKSSSLATQGRKGMTRAQRVRKSRGKVKGIKERESRLRRI